MEILNGSYEHTLSEYDVVVHMLAGRTIPMQLTP